MCVLCVAALLPPVASADAQDLLRAERPTDSRSFRFLPDRPGDRVEPVVAPRSARARTRQLLLFTRDGCDACDKAWAETVPRLITDYDATVGNGVGAYIRVVDTDEPRGRELAKRASVTGLPAYVLIEDYEVRGRLVGHRKANDVARLWHGTIRTDPYVPHSFTAADFGD